MAADKPPNPGAKARDRRTERLAAALRANLKRRKAQLRARAEGGEVPEMKNENPDPKRG